MFYFYDGASAITRQIGKLKPLNMYSSISDELANLILFKNYSFFYILLKILSI